MTRQTSNLLFSPMTTPEHREKAVNALGELLLSDDLATLEKVLAWLQVGLAVAVLALSSRIIATPPPFIQGFALVLPAPLWGALLLTASGVTAWGRLQGDWCQRHYGSAASLIVCGAMCGPLWLKAPGLCCLMVFALVPQTVLAVRMKRECHRRRDCDKCGHCGTCSACERYKNSREVGG